MDEFASWFRNAKQIYSVHSLLISPILGTFRFSCLRTSLTVTSTVLYLYHIYWCATMWIRCAKNVFKAHFSTFIHCISTLYTQYSINKNVNFNFDLSNEINKSEKFAIFYWFPTSEKMMTKIKVKGRHSLIISGFCCNWSVVDTLDTNGKLPLHRDWAGHSWSQGLALHTTLHRADYN